MSKNQTMKTQESRDIQSRTERETVLRPPVDIYEDADGITLYADLPGVSRDRLAVQVDKDTLSIEGQVAVQMPEGMEAWYADVRSARFRRSFTLSGELEPDKISAQMKDGVLKLHIPKRAEAKPKRIEVGTG